MHRVLRSLLPAAVGTSQWVVVANIDIRGFTSYSLSRDSVETALYLKKVYIAIIDGYFRFPDLFYKLTGDGMLLVVPFQEEEFDAVATQVLEDCVQLVKDFAALTADEAMIRFQVPDKLGIGVSAGSASKLTAKGKTLDYSGRVLNQASRLMELARPSGVVFDDSLPITILPRALAARFAKDAVFLRGIAESEAITVHALKGKTQILDRYREPLVEETWAKISETKTVRELRDRGNFRHALRYPPIDHRRIEVEATHPKYRSGKRVRGVAAITDPKFTYSTPGGERIVSVNYPELVKALKSKKVRETDQVTIEIRYPRAKTSPASHAD